jgi:hypothetical protein
MSSVVIAKRAAESVVLDVGKHEPERDDAGEELRQKDEFLRAAHFVKLFAC